MLTQRQEEQLFKMGAVLSFVPFFPLVYHAYEIAFVAKTVPSPSLLSFSLLIVVNMSLGLPCLRRINRLVFCRLHLCGL